jgi:1,2-diacylglycerol 3-alpha-glucosyltransferase
LRIGIFTNCYLPLVNGVVGAIGLLRRGFIEAGHDVHVFAPAFDDYRDAEEQIHRYPALDLIRKVKFPVALPFSPRIDRIIRTAGFDIFHAHHPFVLGPLALRQARRLGIPLVSTFHTQYEQYNHYVPLPSAFVKWAARRQTACFNQAAAGVTTPAESALKILRQYGVDRPITVVPNPTDLARFMKGDGTKIRQRLGFSPGDRVLVNIGRVAPEKNLELLLQSFRRMKELQPSLPLKLMIVGDGPSLDSLQRYASELGIAEQTCFTGMVGPAEIPDYLAAANLFVMTSTTEVKPLAQLEALAAGVPIVAVAAAGANDTIQDGQNGRLVAGDTEAFARAVVELVANEAQLRSFGSNARQTAERYAYTKISGEYLELFEELVIGDGSINPNNL